MHPDWQFPDGVTYLNHGSFGPAPGPVLAARAEWQARLNANPMDFFLRQMPEALDLARQILAEFVRCSPSQLAFVSNATAGMNVAAASISLQPGDEVLLTDHEYGAVVRLWGRRCRDTGAKMVTARLPLPLTSTDDVVEAVFRSATARTKVLVVSHVTSPTGVILPVKEICEQARERGIISIVDGPHAVAMLDLNLSRIPCDFYTASCHKWLSAPFGSGFLVVRGKHQQGLTPPVVSWGRNFRGLPPVWQDEFHWPGTFDPAGWLSVPAAIDVLKREGLESFRARTFALATEARKLLEQLPAAQSVLGALLPPGGAGEWCGSMSAVPLNLPPVELPPGVPHPLQQWLWEEKRTEIPVMVWRNLHLLRVSCHLYNDAAQVRKLAEDVGEWVDEQR